jgi:hypothetical protein
LLVFCTLCILLLWYDTYKKNRASQVELCPTQDENQSFGELCLNLNPSLVELQRSGVTCHRHYQCLRLACLVNIYGDHCQAKIGVLNDGDGTTMSSTLLQCLHLKSNINQIAVQQQSLVFDHNIMRSPCSRTKQDTDIQCPPSVFGYDIVFIVHILTAI